MPKRSGEPPALDVPSAWASSRDGIEGRSAMRQWWRAFDDAQLSALVELGLQANTDVQTALANLRQARALVTVSNATLLPQLDASGTAQRSKSACVPASNLFRAGFDTSWKPDLFGANRAGLAAAQADVLSSAASLGDVQVTVAAEIATNYLAWRGTGVRLNVARENLKLQEETLLIVAATGAALWWSQRETRAQPSYVTAAVTRGDLQMQVTADGTLQPTRTTNIGSELSGTRSVASSASCWPPRCRCCWPT